jgi:hypothetical protein
MTDENLSCEGQSIAFVMTNFSHNFRNYCKYFSDLSNFDKNVDFTRNNTMCFILAVSCIEAKLNEIIAQFTHFLKIKDDVFFDVVDSLSQKLSIEDKWNLLASKCKQPLWDNSKVPFQDFNIIISIRNELIHFKAKPMGKDEVPIKKMKYLCDMFNAHTKASFMEDDVSSWVNDLLSVKDLSKWIYDTLESMSTYCEKHLEKSLLKIVSDSY